MPLSDAYRRQSEILGSNRNEAYKRNALAVEPYREQINKLSGFDPKRSLAKQALGMLDNKSTTASNRTLALATIGDLFPGAAKVKGKRSPASSVRGDVSRLYELGMIARGVNRDPNSSDEGGLVGIGKDDSAKAYEQEMRRNLGSAITYDTLRQEPVSRDYGSALSDRTRSYGLGEGLNSFSLGSFGIGG